MPQNLSKNLKVLAFDSATGACSAALWNGGRIVAHRSVAMERGQSEALMPMIEAVLAEAGWRYGDLDLLAVTIGPGAFTGLRLGLAAARGIALAASLPCLGVTTTEVLALAARRAGAPGPVLAAIDTKRGDFYVQVFDGDGPSNVVSAAEPRVAAAGDLAGLAPAGPLTVVGDGATAALAALQAAGLAATASPAAGVPDAALVAALAAGRYRPGETLPMPSPLYLRAPSTTAPKSTPVLSSESLMPVVPLHAPVIAGLLATCFDDAWPIKDVREILAMPGTYGFVLDLAGGPAGVILCQIVAEEMTVLTLGVLPAWRKTGMARRLLRAAEAKARAFRVAVAFLEVAEDNEAARALYAGSGYVEVGRRADYYKRPVGRRVAALILRRRLTDPD